MANRKPIPLKFESYQCLDENLGCTRCYCIDTLLGIPGYVKHHCPFCNNWLTKVLPYTVPPLVVDTEPMNNETYFTEATKTLSCDYPAIQECLSSRSTIDLLHSTMGLSTESGESLDMLKKHIFYGKDLDLVNLEEELGDMLWYLMVAIKAAREMGCNMSLETIFAKNIAKLEARYQGKFSKEKAVIRDLEKERKILEGEIF